MAACRAHGADRQRLPAGLGRHRHGLRVPGEPGRDRVPRRLARVVPAGRQHLERGLVQPRPETPSYTPRRTEGFDKYRKGTTTTTDYPEADKAKLSDTGK